MDIVVLLCLILLNGLFAMSEIAVLSSREVRLRKLAGERHRGAQSALQLKNAPASFLSTVQVGITMVGILSGAVGEKALIVPLGQLLASIPMLESSAHTLAMVLVVIGLTYVTVVIGELVPKHLGLLMPEKIASKIARPMRMLSHVAGPLVWMLASSSKGLLRFLGVRDRREVTVSNEEIRLLMEQGAKTGVFHESEQILVANVLRLDELPIEAIMTHRQDVQPLELEWSEEEMRDYLAHCSHSRIIVCRGGWGEIVGLLRTADLLQGAFASAPLNIESHLRPASYVPEHNTITQLLDHFRSAQLQCALVVDEYGEIQGLVTLADVLTSIVGQVPVDPTDSHAITPREDGSWLIDGQVAIDWVKQTLGMREELPGEEHQSYHSLAGFIIHVLGRIPVESDQVQAQGYVFEVVDMDLYRIDKVLVYPVSEDEGEAEEAW